MNKNTLGDGAFEDRGLDRDPFAPVTSGLVFFEDHHVPWPTGDRGIITAEVLARLRGLADQVVIIDNLPEHVEVDSDLRASIHPYPPMRSETPLPNLDELLHQLHTAYGQPDNPNPAPGHA